MRVMWLRMIVAVVMRMGVLSRPEVLSMNVL